MALGLAAFAVQAYLKSVLCPSLSDYTPRAPLPLKVSGRFPAARMGLEGAKVDWMTFNATGQMMGWARVEGHITLGAGKSTGRGCVSWMREGNKGFARGDSLQEA